MKKLSIAVVLLAIGFAFGATAGVVEKRIHVISEYASDHAVLQQIKARVVSAQCPQAEAKIEGLAAGACKVTPGTTTCFYWGDDSDPASKTRVDSGFLFRGQLSLDNPQP